MRPFYVLVGLALALLGVGLGSAYVQNERVRGVPLHRTDFAGIPYVLHESTVPGLENRDGETVITAGSLPVAAVLAALESWSSIPSSAVSFTDLRSGSTEPHDDGVQVITFADSPLTRAIVGNAVAITLLRSQSDGVLTDTDIIFNPTLPFSTNLDARTFDIQATLTHELGHALGLDHSGVAGATMFAQVARENRALATLTADDIGFATEVYPAEPAGEFGSLEGLVRLTSGQAVRGASIGAFDPSNNTVVGSITDPDGRYRIGRIPPGNYLVYAEPLDGPARPRHFGSAGSGAEVSFRTDFHGGADSPLEVSVTGGETAQADIAVEPGLPTLNLEGVGSAPLGEPVESFVGASIVAGVESTLVIFGEGLDNPEITEASLSFLGSAIEITPDSFRPGTIRFSDGSQAPSIGVVVTAAVGAPEGVLSLAVSVESEVSVLSGGIRVTRPVSLPQLSSLGVVNAASFLQGPLAPGAIFSIFGEHLGPQTQAGSVGRLNPVTGALLTMIDDTAVTVNGIPAPLFFVRQDQVNVQAPFEIAEAAAAEIVVSYKLLPGEPVSVPVAATGPGVFTFPDGTTTIALHQDGTLNGPQNPALTGDPVSIFGTGQGAIEPPLATGQLAEGPANLSRLMAETSATIDDLAADVLFAGMTPGFVGLLQINLRVPVGARTGPRVPIHLEIGGVAAQPGLTLSVQ